MSKLMTWCVALALAGAVAGCVHPVALQKHGSQGGAIGPWGRPVAVPGIAAMNAGGDAYGGADYLESLSCGSAGNCAGGGMYTDHHGRHQGFVVSQSNGVWHRAIEVPGLGALNAGAYHSDGAGVSSVSCVSAGDCAAGGMYADSHHRYQGFVVSETNGIWGRAIQVPGLAALNVGKAWKPGSAVNSVSCGSPGNCAAGGFYTDRQRHWQGFVVSEVNGHWGRASEVPGLGALNMAAYAAEGAQVTTVSCASAGNCAAGGYYSTDRADQQAFVVSEQNGRWGTAIEVPGLAELNVGGEAEVFSVSCASAGNCAAGGNYDGDPNFNFNGVGHQQGFVVSESNGVWGKAVEVPGLGALNTHGDATVRSVSCPSPGNCTAGGNYDGDSQYSDGYGKGFLVDEKNGTWGRAINVPGLRALRGREYSDIVSVSCASPGNCAAGGYYNPSHGLVVSENNGAWGKAGKMSGFRILIKDQEVEVTVVACAPSGRCVAGGSYRDSRGHFQPFVT